jgi:hypothetical protein
MTQTYPVLAAILGILGVLAAVIAIDIRWTRGTRSPSGVLRGRFVDQNKTIMAKAIAGTIAVLAGYGAGYFAGWWA